jgi:mannose-6-phosphate isomerase-like protein (cupin superfamily)
MPTLIPAPTIIHAAGNRPKRIEEYAGRGWAEPGQRPDFQEITLVLRGTLRVEHDGGSVDVSAGQAIVTHCLPAFSPDTVHRDAAR